MKKQSRWKRGGRVLGVCAVLLLCGCAVRGSGSGARRPAVTAETAVLYARFCANCHGADLGGGMASSLTDGRWAYGGSDADLYASIAVGLEEAGMPSFSAGMRPAQIEGLVAFVRQAETRRAAEQP